MPSSATHRLPIAPAVLDPETFDRYAQSWEHQIDGDSPDVSAWFASSNSKLLNYVYLPEEFVSPLLQNTDGNTVSIRTKFVLVPGAQSSETSSAFSIVLYGIDEAGIRTSEYYLAGVAEVPANVVIVSAANDPIPPKTAAAWIINWNQFTPATISPALFNSETPKTTAPAQYVPLYGYTFQMSDFTEAWQNHSPTEDALWLNFDLRERENAPSGAPLMFGTIVTLNATPPSGDVPGEIKLSSKLFYYDIAKPCPPYC